MITSKWSVWKQVTPPASAVNPSYFIVNLTPCPICWACFITSSHELLPLWAGKLGIQLWLRLPPPRRPGWPSLASPGPNSTLPVASKATAPSSSLSQPELHSLKFSLSPDGKSWPQATVCGSPGPGSPENTGLHHSYWPRLERPSLAGQQ